MAVKNEAANDFRIGQGNSQLRGAGFSSLGNWNAEVSQSVKVFGTQLTSVTRNPVWWIWKS
jgi:hypothetical protein